MFFRRSTTVKYFGAAFVGAALYCEWFIYLMQPIYWADLKCPENDQSCTKILFIADPQIQGDLEFPPPLSYLFNWDSDRYLRSTFSVVMDQLKPDILVYMGDLMDEGSISTMPQFYGYVKRLSSIFNVHYPITQVWIPGDNDIGGENEPIKRDKLVEFDKVFDQPPIITHRNISFIKVNAITHSFPQKTEGLEHDGNYRIVVSHYPVTHRYVFGSQVNKDIRPNIYFCAHEHESKFVKQSNDLTNRHTVYLLDTTILNISGDDYLYEIYVPTCSYRMGTSKIGFGAAVLENNNKNLRYTVFWSPQRFPYLFFYLAVLIVFVLYCLVYCLARLLHRKPKSAVRSTDKVPLLERI
ncbi:metallophosphoesterase 1 [Manduca sexta]|uniref:metallophosphoesterase 1 n=1 Tax=Manduca sexta TaxID=7130 RepID=UPI0011821755|nr:metallophosphoesterase 1 [Manduca sexta]